MQNPLKPASVKTDPAQLRDKTVLVVEDQILIAMDVEEALAEYGMTQVHVVSSVHAALAAIQAELPDLAVLDFNLGDETSEEIARVLRARGIPFLFATGYAGPSVIPTEFQDIPVVRKPYTPGILIREMEKLAG